MPASNSSYAHIALRLGAALAFLYPPIDAIFNPYSWEGYFPNFVHMLPIDPIILLHGFGIIEAVLALWVLSGKYIRIPATIMTLMLVGIVAFNGSEFELLFRDLSIACITLALAFWPNVTASSPTHALQ